MEKNNITLHAWSQILSTNEYTFSNSQQDKDNKNHFSCTWKKTKPTKDGVTSITMNFLFDFQSFETTWYKLYPEVKITEDDVHKSIGLFFGVIGEKTITFGRHYYEELAHLIWNTRGYRISNQFNF